MFVCLELCYAMKGTTFRNRLYHKIEQKLKQMDIRVRRVWDH